MTTEENNNLSQAIQSAVDEALRKAGILGQESPSNNLPENESENNGISEPVKAWLNYKDIRHKFEGKEI